MIIGTTPTHRFILQDGIAEQVSTARITYTQAGKKPLVKSGENVRNDGEALLVDLTQEETLDFDPAQVATVTLKIKTTTDKVMVGKTLIIVKDCEDREEI